jgi:hypothetical protein
MTARRAFHCGLILAALGLAAWAITPPGWLVAAPGEGAEQDADVAAFMRAKLASSQKVLEGLVTKDFELVKHGADEMHRMSEAAEWRHINDPVYEHYSSEFRRLTEKLSRLAEEGNSEGAAFTYLSTTTTCISCHDYVRDVTRVAADEGDPDEGTDQDLRVNNRLRR